MENIEAMVENWNKYLQYVRENNKGKFSAELGFL
jgi:hypothetical protein